MQPDSAIELKQAFTTGLSGAGVGQLDPLFCEFANKEPYNSTPNPVATMLRYQPVVSLILFPPRSCFCCIWKSRLDGPDVCAIEMRQASPELIPKISLANSLKIIMDTGSMSSLPRRLGLCGRYLGRSHLTCVHWN